MASLLGSSQWGSFKLGKVSGAQIQVKRGAMWIKTHQVAQLTLQPALPSRVGWVGWAGFPLASSRSSELSKTQSLTQWPVALNETESPTVTDIA